MLDQWDRVSILLVYRAPYDPKLSLPGLMGSNLGELLRSPRLLLLGGFRIYVEMHATRAGLEFMDPVTSMGLSWHVTGPTHMAGHILDLVFLPGQREDNLKVVNLESSALSLSDYQLLRFGLCATASICVADRPIRMCCSWRLMDPFGFQNVFDVFLLIWLLPLLKARLPTSIHR